MDKALLAGQVGVAGLSLGAFSTTLDLFHTVQAGIGLWKQYANLDEDVQYFKTRLLLLKDLLDTWLSDWYGYGGASEASIGKLRLLKAHEQSIQNALLSAEKELKKLDPFEILEKEHGDHTTGDRMRWVAGQSAQAEVSLNRIGTLLHDLCAILPLQSPNPEARIMVALLHEGQSLPKHISEMLTGDSGPLQLVDRAVQLRQLNLELDADLEDRIKHFKNTIPQDGMEIAEFADHTPEEGTAGSRSRGVRDGKHVLIEWKGYSIVSGQVGIRLRGRNDNLARLLHAEGKPDEMLTLQCDGYFDDVSQKRYGFVFTLPIIEGEEVVSLNKMLKDQTVEELPSLEHRYQAAYSLGLTLSIIFAVEWLHKGIRSHNILFVRRGHQVRWAHPYLSGFAYSRPDKPDEISERLEHSERFNVFRHPLAQGQPKEGYRKTFDIYSFGIILFEFAFWIPAFPLWNQDAAEFRKDITKPKNQQRVAHRMGVDYRDAMLKCVDGSFEADEASAAKRFFVEVVEVLRTCMKT